MTIARLTAVVAGLVLVTGLAACGGDGNGPSVASLNGSHNNHSADDGGGGGQGTNADNAKWEDSMLKYAKCMRSHGVDMPDPTFDSEGHVQIRANVSGKGGSAQDTFKKADNACKHFIENGRPQVHLTPKEQAEMQDRALKLARCMRSKGHDFPDPQVSDDGKITARAAGGKNGPDKSDPNVEKDMQACSRQVGMIGPNGAKAKGGGFAVSGGTAG
jgi:hypothetical protein